MPGSVDLEAFRSRLAKFPRLGIAQLPTPLVPLTRLSEFLGGPRLWMKQESATGLGLGGNKLRKLDTVLREAVDGGADTLVSGGVVQSNSQRQVAAAAAKLGLECHLAVFHGRVVPPGAEYEVGGNILLNRLFGAHVHDVPWTGDRNEAISGIADGLRAEGRRVFAVPYGVSNAAGAIGYASAIVEIADQSKAAGISPKAIIHCSGSGATQAGLVCGNHACLPAAAVIGIDIDAEPDRVRADVVTYAEQACGLLGLTFDEGRVEVVAGHAGPAYGVPHDGVLQAMRLAGSLEGLVLDPVYSGKGLAGLIALIRAGRWTPQDDVVFIHTGGEPALFAYREVLGL